MLLPPPILIEKIDEAVPRERPRHHFGISQAGHKCERYLWLNFRWAVIEKFDGRMLRLFRRGHHEEYFFVEDLRRAGLIISECLEDQKTIDFGSHVKGSPDGVALGVPEAKTVPHITEFKTHSLKSFENLLKVGVVEAKPLHSIQMQCYMYGHDLTRALYVAVCKNDDRLYTERLRLDKDIAIHYIDRSKRIALSERMPEPMNTNPSWWECKFCPAYNFCFDKKIPEVNCRTCAHSTPKEDGTWFCERWKATIPPNAQYDGCRAHVIHPDLIDAEIREFDEWNCYYNNILVGEKGISSKEFLAGFVEEVIKTFKGEIIR